MNWSDRKVLGVGPVGAKIFLCGECPGETEDKEGLPFVGMAGRVLDGMLQEVGIKREDVYITNLCKNKPVNNNFENFTEEYLAKAKAELEEEIAIVQPNILVPCGERAFNTLTQLKGITLWRGSILERGRIKTCGIIHPAAISREWSYRPATVVDLEKIKKEAEFPEIRRTPRTLHTSPDFDSIIHYLHNIIEKKLKVSFDIETETAQITCISFAISGVEAMSIPFWFGSSGSFWSQEQEEVIWQKIKEVLEDSSIPKIAQNAQYDITILADKYGIVVKGLWLDTMIAFHSVYPELPKGLNFLCSIYTDIPYYKFLRKTDDMVKFFEYNALDAVTTYECAEKIYAEMVEAKMVDFYYEHMHSLIYPLMDITHMGVRIDTAKKKEAIKQYKEEVKDLQAELLVTVGHELNTASPKQMFKWLYEELALPKQFRRRIGATTKTLTADEEAIDVLYTISHNEALKKIIDIRERQKILSTYLEVKYDKEERVLLHENENGQIVETGRETMERARTSYLITGTETGRLSSRETVYGTGGNLQNVPKGITRRIFIPDTGKVFVNADLSQAEARVVAWLAGEEHLIRVFNEGGDIHRKNAANIYRKKSEEVTEEEREIAKRITHAANYLVGPITFSKTAGVSVSDAKRLLNQYFAEYPRIKLWHMYISSQLKKTRTLTTPFGRKRTFFNRWDESLVREGVAFIPQSTCADLLNMGLRRFYEKTQGTKTNILLNIHDAILCQTPRTGVDATCRLLKDTLSIPIVINNRELLIPVDISIGENWDSLTKIKL